MTREQAHDFIYRMMIVHPNEGHLSAIQRADKMLDYFDNTGKNTKCILPNFNTLTVCRRQPECRINNEDWYDVIEEVGWGAMPNNHTAGTGPYEIEKPKSNRVLLLTNK